MYKGRPRELMLQVKNLFICQAYGPRFWSVCRALPWLKRNVSTLSTILRCNFEAGSTSRCCPLKSRRYRSCSYFVHLKRACTFYLTTFEGGVPCWRLCGTSFDRLNYLQKCIEKLSKSSRVAHQVIHSKWLLADFVSVLLQSTKSGQDPNGYACYLQYLNWSIYLRFMVFNTAVSRRCSISFWESWKLPVKYWLWKGLKTC